MYNTHSTLSAGKQIRLKTVADVTNGLQGRSAFVLSTAETYDAKVCSEVQEIGRELKKGNETEKKKHEIESFSWMAYCTRKRHHWAWLENQGRHKETDGNLRMWYTGHWETQSTDEAPERVAHVLSHNPPK